MRISLGKRVVRLLVEAERHRRAAHENRPLDEVRLIHHQIDRLFLGPWQRPLLEHRAARADEIEEVVFVDVLLEERAVRRILVDVAFFDVDVVLFQITSGVAAGRSGGFPVEGWFRHVAILSRASETAERFAPERYECR